MKCNKCKNENCQIINEVHTTGKDFSASKGCCGGILFYPFVGPLGVLCGLCGEGKKTNNAQYWVCNNCGHKWRV